MTLPPLLARLARVGPARVARRAQSDPIGVYLRELEGRLGKRRIFSRRALSEVRAHLVESAEELARGSGGTHAAAQREAIARFGGATELARDLLAVRRPRSAAAQRLVTLWVAWAAAMAMGSATVWAAVDLQSTSHASAHRAGHGRAPHAIVAPPSALRAPSAAKRLRCDHALSAAEQRCERAPRARNGR
jgi:hypothetical protein